MTHLEVELVDIVLRESERLPQHDLVLQCERTLGRDVLERCDRVAGAQTSSSASRCIGLEAKSGTPGLPRATECWNIRWSWSRRSRRQAWRMTKQSLFWRSSALSTSYGERSHHGAGDDSGHVAVHGAGTGGRPRRSSGSGPFTSRWASVSPSRYSITRKSIPFAKGSFSLRRIIRPVVRSIASRRLVARQRL